MKASFKKISMLLVDDNQVVLNAIKDIAEDQGFEVVCAIDRKTAESLVSDRCFDVALVDKRLVENDDNNEDGLAIIKKIQAFGEGTYVILMTAYGKYKDAVELQKHGVVAYVEKTKSPLDMYSIIQGELNIAKSNLLTQKNKNNDRDKKGFVALFYGQDNPAKLNDDALRLLKPKGGSETMGKIIEELMDIVYPIIAITQDINVDINEEKNIIESCFWSRGLGYPVMVIISKNDYLDLENVPVSERWSEYVKLEEIVYKRHKENIYSMIIKCSNRKNTGE